MKKLLALVSHLLAFVGLLAVAGVVWSAWQGIGARSAPPSLEVSLARTARHFAIPAAARSRNSPEAATAETIRAGMEHWADHCASCHANDGSGATEMGQGLYPRAPDMRQPATQTLTDGELFFIIENGVKLTGMPAWGTGTPEGELASWHLVHFIRHLPKLTEQELEEMQAFNPRSLEEWRQLEDERRFLAGESVDPAPPADSPRHIHKGDPK